VSCSGPRASGNSTLLRCNQPLEKITFPSAFRSTVNWSATARSATSCNPKNKSFANRVRRQARADRHGLQHFTCFRT